MAHAAGLILALGSAVAWGGADFLGGLASRRTSTLEVVAVSRLAVLLLLGSLAALTADPLPSLTSTAWAAAAGASGGLGIAALYRGLATDRSALVAPTSGVLGAAVPVVFAAVVAGILPLPQQAGLVAALVGIFLVSRVVNPSESGASRGITMGLLAGLGFGGFFVFLGQVAAGPVLTPLVVTSLASLSVALGACGIARSRWPSLTRNRMALAAGGLDGSGALCYLLAIRWIRLDVAAVLGSLYPAITVLLFRMVLRERVSRTQWVGLTICVAAIALIAW